MFLHNINPVLLELGPFQIRYYGLFYALGFVIAYFLIYYLAKRKEIDITKDDVADLMLYSIIGVVLGSRLVYVFVYNPLFYLQNPLDVFAVWNGGLSFHGGLIGAIVASYLFSKKKKIHFYDLADLAVIPVVLGLALGRLGNLMNGELFGRITNVGWCIDYSTNQYIGDIPDGCRHPSQIYASFKNLAIFAVLWVIKDKKLPRGFLFWSFVTMYGLFRTIVELFRQPDPQIGFIFNYFTMGQLLSIPLFLIGGYMLFRLYREKN
ncbi:prolipoprotein diacylglyceryl transferase [Candidatus Woesearchaeota archaeon]|jgi:phosphatidylglycerol:prolipoprotein diacylglycerol transferase|nr:prolipoprotein diacylglyceryl transferase [Candidatus Woesearchaeota archaeon]MAG91804.1 prolipoprotein diacylglyceryl transferase [Candidatus Woesearchaeota archaeon]|tara:strand:+ start:7921 stop:8712 length:792 start_codon:yes stop_codon:yes gene_type:complete